MFGHVRARRYGGLTVRAAAQPLEGRLLLASQPVADLYTRPADAYPSGVTDVNGTAFFAATNEGVGRELYKSDGTPGGTALVKDINPGPGGSDPSALINVNGTLFFIATLAPDRKELWKSDGTAAGTVRVSDNVNLHIPTFSGGDPNMEVLNHEVYFRGYDPVAGVEVWKSDGTDAGTVRVKDINPGAADSRPAYFERVGDVLVFSADDGSHGTELWKTDGTEAGTTLVKDISPGNTGFQHDLTRSGDFVYFAEVSQNTSSLWRTDGTPSGTVLLTTQTASGPGIQDLTDVNGTLYFGEYSIGNQLWKSDGTPQGTQLVKDFTDYEGFYAYAESLTNVSGTLFFRLIKNRPVESDLWKSDGTTKGTVRLDTFPSPTGNVEFIDKLVPVGNRLFFSAFRADTGRELWSSDGTPGGSRLVKDIEPGPAGSDALPLAAAAGVLFFSAHSGASGTELWRSNGTAAGTQLAGDINPGTAGSYPHDLADVNGTLFFTTEQNDTATLIYKTNPEQDGVVRVAEGQSPLGPLATGLEGSGNTLYFGVYQIGPVAGPWLVKSDGTQQGTVEVAGGFNGVRYITDLDGAGTVLFSGTGYDPTRGSAGQELWRSDGTAKGTVLVKDINPAVLAAASPQAFAGSSDPAFLTNVGGTVFFSANDGEHGRELWKSDGTEAGTVLVKDVVPGGAGSDPWGLVAVGSRLFFRVTLPGGGAELWKSDGTTPGTVRVAALPNTTGLVTGGFASVGDWRRGAALGDLFIFAAGGADTGASELWRSDGTETGTLRVADTGPGPTGPRNADPRWFARYGDRVFFNAYDPQWGRELWSTDGTARGTALFEDIYPGVGSSDPAWLEVSGGTLWFGAADNVIGNELRKVTIDFSTDSRVIERQLFYNNSVFDQHDDDPTHDLAAVATDKRALLAGGGVAGFENLSSYTRGINGLVVGFFSPGQARPHDLGPDDFEFRMGADGDPALWPLAPAPAAIRVIPVPGPNSFYALTWPDGAIRNTWLRCTVKANDHTNLAAPDVFYFGNLAGETGDGDSRTRAMPRVTAIDLANVRRSLNSDALRTSPVDINRDGRVNSLDLAAVRSNYNQHLPPLTTPPPPPAPPPPATAVLRDGGGVL